MTPLSQDGHNGGRPGQAGPLPARHTPADGRVGYRSAGRRPRRCPPARTAQPIPIPIARAANE